jgi:hypothetical protein
MVFLGGAGVWSWLVEECLTHEKPGNCTSYLYLFKTRYASSIMVKTHGLRNYYLYDNTSVVKNQIFSLSEQEEESSKKKIIPSLLPLAEGDNPGHGAVFVNELRLSDFKIVLMKNGISSEFIGGVLFCGNGSVALRRHDSGRVTIEGTLCPEYYVVRDLLYEQYAII